MAYRVFKRKDKRRKTGCVPAKKQKDQICIIPVQSWKGTAQSRRTHKNGIYVGTFCEVNASFQHVCGDLCIIPLQFLKGHGIVKFARNKGKGERANVRIFLGFWPSCRPKSWEGTQWTIRTKRKGARACAGTYLKDFWSACRYTGWDLNSMPARFLRLV